MCTRRGVSIPRTLVACAGFVGAATWTADFAQSDGPPEGWVVTQPDVTVQSEVLTLTAVGGEPHVFAGVNDAPPWFEGVGTIEYNQGLGEISVGELSHGWP